MLKDSETKMMKTIYTYKQKIHPRQLVSTLTNVCLREPLATKAASQHFLQPSCLAPV